MNLLFSILLTISSQLHADITETIAKMTRAYESLRKVHETNEQQQRQASTKYSTGAEIDIMNLATHLRQTMRDSRLCSNEGCEEMADPEEVANGRRYCSRKCREDAERREMRADSGEDRLMVPSGAARRWLEGTE